jgi:hypothetical protein
MMMATSSFAVPLIVSGCGGALDVACLAAEQNF